MQRLFPSGIAAMLSILAITVAPACSKDEPAGDKAAAKQAEPKPGPEPVAESGAGPAMDGEAKSTTEAPPPEGEVADTAAAEGGAPVPEPVPAEDAIPGLLAQAESLETDDEVAKTALADALAAGGAKMDVAKVANKRGEALLSDGESERAAAFFQWAADTHTLYSEPIYNLATISANAGDLDAAKEQLAELKKRGNKKLMKKVGVDPVFALLADDPDVRKIYEQ